MDKTFQKRIDKLHSQLEELKKCKEINRNNLSSIPERGVYLLIEKRKYIYVGRTNKMNKRLLQHGRLSAGYNVASFAFKLAKEEANKQGIDVNRKRKELVADEKFDKLFLEARQRVAKMSIKYIEITNSVDQYLFEVYAAEVLKTDYNDFENH